MSFANIPTPTMTAMPPPSAVSYLTTNGWTQVYGSSSELFFTPTGASGAPVAYYTWSEALAYEMFSKFTLGAFK